MEGPGHLFLLVVAVVLIFASVFFSLFKQSLKAARKASLIREADDAEKRAAAKRQGSVGYRREIAKAARFRKVLDTLESPGRPLAVASFWMHALRSIAAAFAGLFVGRLEVAIIPLFFDTVVGGSYSFWVGPTTNAAIYYVAILAVLIVFVILITDYLARNAARFAPERIAAALLKPVKVLGLPLLPFMFLGRILGKLLRRVFPPKTDREGMTEDELRHALIEGEKSGIVESKERAMVEGVFYLGDRPLGVFMTHRSEVQWLDVNMPAQDILDKVLEHKTQRCFPVVDGTLDAIIGAAYLEDIILDLASESLKGQGPTGLKAIMKKASFAPETMPALKAFEALRRGEADFLFVMDEYGGFAGMVSAWSLMEKIVGELAAPAKQEDRTVQNEDGSLIVSGSSNIDDIAGILSLPGLDGSGDYHTLAGLVLSLAGELPSAGDSFTYRGYSFTVLDMDGNRINKVGIAKTA